jgi:serine/threonine protein kinase
VPRLSAPIFLPADPAKRPYRQRQGGGGFGPVDDCVELSQEAVALLSRLLHPDPTRRPTAGEALGDIFFQSQLSGENAGRAQLTNTPAPLN